MRLGAYKCNISPSSKIADAYRDTTISERHRHRYVINLDYKGDLEKNGLICSGISEDGTWCIAHFYRNKGDHIITVCTEHKCVLDSCRHLENEGFKVTYLPVKQNGIIDLLKLEEAITDRTILVSVMMANIEIGVIQPAKEIVVICRSEEMDDASLFAKRLNNLLGKVVI
jgi:hypothetical protein